MFDPMAELTGSSSQADDTSTDSSSEGRPPRQNRSGGGGRYAEEVHSVTIHAKQRTFYIDLKQSGNGKFFKVSEKSRNGQKSTIMFDAEDLDDFIKAFEEMKAHVA